MFNLNLYLSLGINPFPFRRKVKWLYATNKQPFQPASNSQAVQVLCSLLLRSILVLEMKALKLESSRKGLKFDKFFLKDYMRVQPGI